MDTSIVRLGSAANFEEAFTSISNPKLKKIFLRELSALAGRSISCWSLSQKILKAASLALNETGAKICAPESFRFITEEIPKAFPIMFFEKEIASEMKEMMGQRIGSLAF